MVAIDDRTAGLALFGQAAQGLELASAAPHGPSPRGSTHPAVWAVRPGCTAESLPDAYSSSPCGQPTPTMPTCNRDVAFVLQGPPVHASGCARRFANSVAECRSVKEHRSSNKFVTLNLFSMVNQEYFRQLKTHPTIDLTSGGEPGFGRERNLTSNH